jgi:hypothetical protein
MREEAKDVLDELKKLQQMNADDSYSSRELYVKAAKIVYDKFENNLNEKLQFTLELIDIAKENKDRSLLDAIIGANDLFFERTSRIYLDINMEIAKQFWSSSIEDVIGSFQFLRDPTYIDQLHKVAVDSLPSWKERQDENQQFFRKCTWALGEISTREFGEHRAIDTLVEMAKVAPPVAAYWAKKQINRRLGKDSPYADEDMDQIIEVDFDWPHSSPQDS